MPENFQLQHVKKKPRRLMFMTTDVDQEGQFDSMLARVTVENSVVNPSDIARRK